MRLIFLFIFYLILTNCFGQYGELDKFDCTYSKEITVPFNYSENKLGTKPLLNQTVFYSFRDQFTYFYKITSKINTEINFMISALNDSDSYAVYIYQYNNSDFCDKLYSKKIKPLSAPYYIGYLGGSLNSTTKNINAVKDNIYFISVINTSLNNCGHKLLLSVGTDSLKVKALHAPCKRDMTALIVNTKFVKIPTIKKDTLLLVKPIQAKINVDTLVYVKPKQVTIDNDSANNNIHLVETNSSLLVEFLIKDKNTKSKLNTNFLVVDEFNEPISLIKNANGKLEMELVKSKKYKLKCTALGYKDLQMPLIVLNENSIELFLEPLKVGDNFIMKSIYFHPNTYALRKESEGDLQRLLHYLESNLTVEIEIQGHTNGDNKIYKNKIFENLSEEWNFQGSAKNLSLKRSESIKKYLIQNGINMERLYPVGKGGSKPIILKPETMDEGQKNIRVEVVILKN